MDWDYEKQLSHVKVVMFAQSAAAILITGFVLCTHLNIIEAPFDIASGMSGSYKLKIVFSVILLLILLLYSLIQLAVRRMSQTENMHILKFWVKQLHSRSRTSAMSILIAPPSLGEASVILSALHYFLSDGSLLLFSIGAFIGLMELALAFPLLSLKQKLIMLDRMVE